MATKSKAQLAQEALDKEEAMKRLREILEPVHTIYTHVTWVNRTGDQRTIMALVAVKPWHGDRYGGPAQIIDLSWQLSRIGLGKHSDAHGGITVGGGGMDMGFHLVTNISRWVFPEWMCKGEFCLSNTHVNEPRETRRPGLVHTDDYRFYHRQLS